MAGIEFSKGEKALIVQQIQLYFREELDQELGGFDAEFLLDFFAQEVGAYFYNRGLYDAQTVLEKNLDTINDAIHTLEKPTRFVRS